MILPLGLGLDEETNPRVRVVVQYKDWLVGRAWAENRGLVALSAGWLSKAASQVLVVEKGSELNQMDRKNKKGHPGGAKR